jgi:hypothetical protein
LSSERVLGEQLPLPAFGLPFAGVSFGFLFAEFPAHVRKASGHRNDQMARNANSILVTEIGIRLHWRLVGIVS